MKRNLLLFFVLISGIASSQISLSHSDYQNAFSVGAVFQTFATPIGGDQFEVFVGEPSSTAQIWDLSLLPFEYVAISRSIVPSTAPFFPDFPSSNLVLYEKYWFSPGDSLFSWNYKELQSNKLLLHGQSDEYSVYLSWDPPAVQAMIPLTYGTNWVSEWDSTYIMPEVYTISETRATVDAFGTLILSNGDFPCLRLRHDHLTISYTPVGSDTSRTRSFNFYTKEMFEVHLGTIYEDQFDLTTIWTNGVKLSGRQGSVGVSPIEPPARAMITGIYPNPAAEVAEIHYTLKSNAKVIICIADLSGREVGMIAVGQQAAGDHKSALNVSGIPSGIYFCRVQANERIETQKLIICR